MKTDDTELHTLVLGPDDGADVDTIVYYTAEEAEVFDKTGKMRVPKSRCLTQEQQDELIMAHMRGVLASERKAERH